VTATLTWWPELISGEACDRCGASAKLQVVFPNGLDLLLCGRHADQHITVLCLLDVDLRRSP
jgi:hypothetical protein